MLLTDVLEHRKGSTGSMSGATKLGAFPGRLSSNSRSTTYLEAKTNLDSIIQPRTADACDWHREGPTIEKKFEWRKSDARQRKKRREVASIAGEGRGHLNVKSTVNSITLAKFRG